MRKKTVRNSSKLQQLKDKIKAYQYGMPEDQLTAAEKRLIKTHAEWFENDGGYIKVLKEKLPLNSSYRNPSKRELILEYKRRYGITNKFTKDNIYYIVEVAYNIDLNSDFYLLNQDQQQVLHDLAIITGYRRSKTASGSIGREFFKSLGRKRKRNSKRNGKEIYNADKLDELSAMFQGHVTGEEISTVGSDYTPPLTSRLGKLVYIKLKTPNGTIYEGSFKGDAWAAMDARKNIYFEGRNARIKNVKTPPKGQLWYVGEVLQGNYVTDKSHIENGQTVEFYHELGEIDGIRPNAFLDHDGFLVLVGGNYDIGVHGIEN